MRSTPAFALSLLLAAGLVVPCAAQESAPPDIIVEAAPMPENVETAAQAMAREVTATTFGGQVARWVDPLCVRVEGLTADHAAQVDATVRSVAADADVRLGGQGCDANVFILFTNGADGVTAALRGRSQDVFRQVGPNEFARFLNGPGPLRWVARLATRETRRGPLVANSAALMNSGDFNMRIDVPTADSYDPSMIRRPTRAAIDGMIVLVDASAAEGLGLTHVAEYAAMVILAQPPMTGDFSAYPSVLSLGGYRPGAAAGPRLGDWDRAFLTALYAAPMDRSAAASCSLVGGRMARRLRNN